MPAEVVRSPEQRIVEAAARLPPTGAVTGWAACRMHGAAFHDGVEGDVLLSVPLLLGGGNIRPDPGVRLLRDRLYAGEVVTVSGVPCTVPERAMYDAMRLAGDLRGAVRAADMALAGEITSLRRFDAWLERRRTSSPLVRRARPLTSERSRSPRESDLRLLWTLDARLPTPLVNHPVLDRRGRLIGVPDLFDPVAGHVVEYDGADHRGKVRHARDIDREAAFRGVGLEFTRVVSLHLEHPAAVVRRLLADRARALWLPESERAWQLGDPGPSLDDEIAYREMMQAQHAHWESVPMPDISGW